MMALSFFWIASLLAGTTAISRVLPNDCEVIFEYYESNACHKHKTVQKGLKFHNDVSDELDGDWQDYLEVQAQKGGIFATDPDFVNNEAHLDTFEVVDVGTDPEGRYHAIFNIRFVEKESVALDRGRRSGGGPASFGAGPMAHVGTMKLGEVPCVGGVHTDTNTCCDVGFGTVSSSDGGFACEDCSVLSGGQFYSDVVARRDDAANGCVRQEVCNVTDGMFYKTPNNQHRQLQNRCQRFQSCTARGLLMTSEGVEHTDRVCGAPILRCNYHQFWMTHDGDNTQVAELTVQPTCVALSVCAQGTYWSNKDTMQRAKTGESIEDKICSPKKVCTANEYTANTEQQTNDETEDAVCRPITVCNAGTHEEAAPTLADDRVCRSDLTCTADEYEVKPPTQTSQRVCAPIRICDVSTEYTSTIHTPTSNAACTPRTECIDSQYVAEKGTATTDRVCGGGVMGGTCANDRTWRKANGKNSQYKGCAWVSKKAAKRCNAKGMDGNYANEACPKACGACNVDAIVA